jgi:hypothetical protein
MLLLQKNVMFVRSLSPPKLAGIAPQIFADILQIRRGSMITKKNNLI